MTAALEAGGLGSSLRLPAARLYFLVENNWKRDSNSDICFTFPLNKKKRGGPIPTDSVYRSERQWAETFGRLFSPFSCPS